MPEQFAHHLGDGAYVKAGRFRGELILYTSDGTQEKNHVYLEPGAVDELQEFARTMASGLRGNMLRYQVVETVKNEETGHTRRYPVGCEECAHKKEHFLKTGLDLFYPNHEPSPNCKSGRRPHCTCDTCF